MERSLGHPSPILSTALHLANLHPRVQNSAAIAGSASKPLVKFSSFPLSRIPSPLSTLIPGTMPKDFTQLVQFCPFPWSCLAVSSWKITPEMQCSMPGAVRSISLYFLLLSALFSRLIPLNFFSTEPGDSSAARIPLPGVQILLAVSINSFEQSFASILNQDILYFVVQYNHTSGQYLGEIFYPDRNISPNLFIQEGPQLLNTLDSIEINFSIIVFEGMERYAHLGSLQQFSQDPYLNSKYQLMGLIGQGCFGKVLKAQEKRSGRLCALKVQHFKNGKVRTVLRNEIAILKKLQGLEGIPVLYGCGEWGKSLYCEMELLESDMNAEHKYSVQEITELTLDLLKVMQGIHKAGIVHQDLKPHNIMRKAGKLFIIDFGLARQLNKEESKNLYTIKGFIGTPRYASVRAHNMFEQGQKDDLESLFYIIAYFYYQRLPWSKLRVANQGKLEKIKLLKVRHQDSLFNQMPLPFQQAFQYITGLAPFDQPDYNYLIGLFKRSRTLKLPGNFLQNHQRTNVKRISLNMSNFLQVPDTIYEHKSRRNDQQRSKNSRCSGAASDAIQSEYLEFEQDNKENFCESDDIEPTLPDISKFCQNIVMRNPFG